MLARVIRPFDIRRTASALGQLGEDDTIHAAMQFHGGVDSLNNSCNAVSVQYKDRVWEIDLNSDKGVIRDITTMAFDLQGALNLARPPVGLRLRVAPGAEAVVCPLSVLIACPSYIATTFQGMEVPVTDNIFLSSRAQRLTYSTKLFSFLQYLRGDMIRYSYS